MGKWIILYLLAVNLAGFVLMGVDKRRAVRRLWRIPERMLFLSALLGGSFGALVGMYVFHHKTRHWTFFVGIPAILAAQIALGFWICTRVGA